MTKRTAIVTVVATDSSEALAQTAESLVKQTVPCIHYCVVIRQRCSLITPGTAIRIDLPLADNQLLLARAIGLQLAFNEGAEIAACLEPGEIAEPQCGQFVANELEKTAVDILELRHPGHGNAQLGRLFYSKKAAFVPALWGQIHPIDEAFATPIINQVIAKHGVSRRLIVAALISPADSGPSTKVIPFGMPLSDERFIRRLYQQTGLLFGRVQRTRARKVNSVAVITPYYKESLTKLQRCHQSVMRQGTNVQHYMIADGCPQSDVNQWDITHITLPQAHGDNGNTPRGIGGMIAFAKGFDALAYLDADNWFGDGHIDSMRQTQHHTGASVVCSWRTVVLPDGTVVEELDPEDKKKTHVDTSCYLITREVAFLASLWARMPQVLGPICDRIFFGGASEAEPNIAWTNKRTAFFESNYRLHYKMAGKVSEGPVHAIPPNLWREMDPLEFRERTGKTITLVRGQSAFSRSKKRPKVLS
jgi:hypothetical protein